jgi:signal transduction histidine kinase
MTGNPERLQELLDEQAALRRVATMVAQDTPAGTLFDRVCQELGGVLSVKSTDMIRYDDDGQATVVGAWATSGEPSFPVGERVPIDPQTVTGKVFLTGQPQRVDDYSGVGGELAGRLREAGILSVVGAPINVAGRMWGSIMATSAQAGAFPADTEHRIGGFAELVTAALADADAREKLATSRARIVAAGDAARRRIERDLHDGAQQRLVALALNLRLLQEGVGEGSVAAGLATARAELDLALTELRELARGIHPSVLTERGLAAALDALAKRAPMPVDLEADAACDRVALPLQTTAYFVVAEALTNATKHAECSRAGVRVQLQGESVVVEVSDDGTGGADADGGSGLGGLADRVSALDGAFEVTSPTGGGTTIRAQLPLAYCERLEQEVAVASSSG